MEAQQRQRLDTSCLICVTYQHPLELFYRLIGNTDAINLSDLISYMQCPWSGEIIS